MTSQAPKFRIEGVQDELVVYDDHLTLTPQGVLGFLNKGLKGTKSIPFSSITATQMKEGGMLFNGYLQFSMLGGNESRQGIMAAIGDENTFLFKASANDEVHRVKSFIEAQIRASRTPTAAAGASSIGDELAKLGDLHRQGLLSADEFAAAKARLLR